MAKQIPSTMIPKMQGTTKNSGLKSNPGTGPVVGAVSLSPF
jgi:hypothetical protein